MPRSLRPQRVAERRKGVGISESMKASVATVSTGGTNLTDWVYRGGSFAALLGVITWLGLNLVSGQATLAKDFSAARSEFQQKLLELRNDMQVQNSTTNTGVTVVNGQVGQISGSITMITQRLERQGSSINELRDRVTRLEALRGVK